ncbi:RING finger protein 11 [Myotis davidii]|uniref:RING finger protein 11 n=1 Tax=Myotis davidii TaxID=225400 RepID=L5LK21_MYODS|nr:RING finger protein 11 [Myotis davidii]
MIGASSHSLHLLMVPSNQGWRLVLAAGASGGSSTGSRFKWGQPLAAGACAEWDCGAQEQRIFRNHQRVAPMTATNAAPWSGALAHLLYHPSEQVPVPVYHPTPSQTRLATQLTEEEQIRIAQRIGLIQHLPKGVYDPGRDGSEKKIRECVICMMDFVYGDPIRFLPCMHIYHLDCIDDWLMRSFTCPSCMEPVDAALLSSYETN